MNDEKIARWQSAVDAAPDDELARFTLARATMEAGRLEEACAHFRRALELKPDWMMACILQARCLVELEEGDAARALLARARGLAEEQGHRDPLIEIDELLEELDAGGNA